MRLSTLPNLARSHLSFAFRTIAKRSFSQETTAATTQALVKYHRTVFVSQIPTGVTPTQILDNIRVGPLEHISHDPINGRAWLAFFEPETATTFRSKFNEWDGRNEMRANYSNDRPVRVENIAAMGLRNASRAIRIFPVPESATKESLEQELSRFGSIEKIHFGDEKNGKRAAHIHFNSMNSAFKAVQTLRVEKGWGGEKGISFAHDRCDLPLKIVIRKMRAAQDADALRSSTAILQGISKDITHAKLLTQVKDLLPAHNGEALLSLEIKAKHDVKTENATAFFNFANPSLASLFLEAVKARPIDGVKPFMKSRNLTVVPPNLYRATRLGATRRVLIKGLDKQQASQSKIFDDFKKFGKIAGVFIDQQEDYANAFITYTHITDAMKVIDRVYQNNRNFRRYAGAKISFAAEVIYGQPIPSILPLPIKEVEAEASTQENTSTSEQP